MPRFNDENVQKLYDNVIAVKNELERLLDYLETLDEDVSIYAVREETVDALAQIGALLSELGE
jgi:hypothetical protein